MIVIIFILRFSLASLWSLRLTDENDAGKFIGGAILDCIFWSLVDTH